MSRAGIRNGENITARVRKFLCANPDEELEYADLLAKFGVGRRSAQIAMANLQREGTIECVRIVRVRFKGCVR